MKKRRIYQIAVAAAVLLLVAAGLLRTCAVDEPQVAENQLIKPGGVLEDSSSESDSEPLSVPLSEEESAPVLKDGSDEEAKLPLDVRPVVSDDPDRISGIQSDSVFVSIPETTPPPRPISQSDTLLPPRHSDLAPESPDRTFSLAVKTNLLFDILATPNIEVEFPFARDRFSVMGEFWFPWWVGRDDSWCYEVLYGGLEARWWFQDRTGREALTGHFLGLYAGGGLYDLEWKSKGYQGEFLVAAGVSYGYSFRLNESLRIETSLGVGYMRTDYRHYIGMEENNFLVWQYDGIFSWLGPTKAKVSLVWLLGGKKGGRR